MTQRHYLDSVKVRDDLDPLFCSLLRHHWMEEAQHAKLDVSGTTHPNFVRTLEQLTPGGAARVAEVAKALS